MKYEGITESVGSMIRKAEQDYIYGTTTISKYVQKSMYDDLNRIDAYLNSKHISGSTDSQGREKPFFNIVTAAVNIWYRATDIDRKHIKVRPSKSSDATAAFLASVVLQDWMRREKFGTFLNEWGRVLARYGSAVCKFVEKDGRLIPLVVPWNKLIVDPVDFEGNIKIEVIELTEAELRKKPYDKEKIKALCSARTQRKTLDGQTKDNKADYIKLYEVHGEMPLSLITGKDEDRDEYVQQMHVISFVETTNMKGEKEYEDFTLISGREDVDPYMLTHLIKEDGQTLSIGAVEHLFEAQWMVNHTAKAIKDQLDLASKIVFQTADVNFIGQNVLDSIENGQVLIHGINMPLTQANTSSHDITSLQSFGSQWRVLANEINGISEAMMGEVKSGTAWRQTEALLQESHSLFELMTENKGLHIEDMFRTHIIRHIKTKLDTKDEVMAILDSFEINKIDARFVNNKAKKIVNEQLVEMVLNDEDVTPETPNELMAGITPQLEEPLKDLGNQRFFKPSEADDVTWKDLFKDLEWNIEVDVTGEAHNIQEVFTTLNTALQVIANPGFSQNKRAQMIVDKILTQTNVISPIELASLPEPMPQMPASVT